MDNKITVYTDGSALNNISSDNGHIEVDRRAVAKVGGSDKMTLKNCLE